MPDLNRLELIDERPRQREFLGNEREIQAALAAHFTALGYYLAIDLELPRGYGQVVDVAGIRPILKELKDRYKLGPAPAGVLSWLDYEEWTLTETVIKATESDPDFIRGVLMESEDKGWVEKKVVAEDLVHWRLKNYHYPAREAFIASCGSNSPLEAFHHLTKTEECCNCLYMVLDYEVDREFMDMCLQRGVGLLIYVPRNGYFREVIPPEHREIMDRRGFMSLCEKILFENYILRRDDWI